MKELVIHIHASDLTFARWNEYTKGQQEHIFEIAEKWSLVCYPEPAVNKYLFAGERDELYGFLYDLAYKYDISLI